MKINEIILETAGKMKGELKQSLPSPQDWPDLDSNNNSYKQYRFGIACARAPDQQDMPFTTSTHMNLVTIGYSEGDKAILDAAAKVMGVAPHRLGNEKSLETDEINRQSPVVPRKKNKYGV